MFRPRTRLSRQELDALRDLTSALKQPRNTSGKVGDERGSQSPGTMPTMERHHAAGVNTGTTSRKAAGNP